MRSLLFPSLGESGQVSRDRLGLDAGEEGVTVAVYLNNLGISALKDCPEVASPGAIHGIDNYFKASRPQPGNVNETVYLLQVDRSQRQVLHQPLCQSLRQRQPVDLSARLNLTDEFFNLSGNFVRGAGAVLVFILEAVPDGRIVAGGDNHRPAGFFSEDAEADDRSGGGAGTEINFDTVAGHHLCHGGGKVLGGKTGIIADNQATAG